MRHICSIHLRGLLLLSALLAFVLPSNAIGSGQDIGSRPLMPRSVDLTFAAAVRETLAEARVPGGMALEGSGSGDDRVHYEIGGTLDDTIRMFGAQNPLYRVGVISGVVNVFPKRGVPPFLMTRIAHLEVNVGDSVYKSWNEMQSSREVREALERLRLREGWKYADGRGQAKVIVGTSNGASDTVVLRDVSILDALNEIARRSGTAVWEYREYDFGTARAYSFRIY